MRIRSCCWIGLTVALTGGSLLALPISGNPQTLLHKYREWKESRQSAGDALTLGLGWSRGLSTEHTAAHGSISILPADGTVEAEVAGMKPGSAADLWLVENVPGPGKSVRADPGERAWRIGRLHADVEGRASFTATLDPLANPGFELDYVVVTAPGRHPRDNGLLFGSPSLFERLYRAEAETDGG